MRVNDQNEMMFFYFQCKIFYLTMLIVCKKHLSQSDLMDCKIITTEREEKVFLEGSLNGCQYFEIQ